MKLDVEEVLIRNVGNGPDPVRDSGESAGMVDDVDRHAMANLEKMGKEVKGRDFVSTWVVVMVACDEREVLCLPRFHEPAVQHVEGADQVGARDFEPVEEVAVNNDVVLVRGVDQRREVLVDVLGERGL